MMKSISIKDAVEPDIKLKRFDIEEVGELKSEPGHVVRVDPALGPDAYSDTWFAIYVRDHDGLAVHVADRKSLESAESLLNLILCMASKEGEIDPLSYCCGWDDAMQGNSHQFPDIDKV